MTEKPQLCDISEPGLGVGSSTRSGSPWVPHRALDTNVHRRWKDEKSFWLQVQGLESKTRNACLLQWRGKPGQQVEQQGTVKAMRRGQWARCQRGKRLSRWLEEAAVRWHTGRCR